MLHFSWQYDEIAEMFLILPSFPHTTKFRSVAWLVKGTKPY